MFMEVETQQSTINPAFAAHFARHLREATACGDCTDEAQCEYHDVDYDELIMLARSHRNIAVTRNRLYFSREDGRLRLNPPDHIDDS